MTRQGQTALGNGGHAGEGALVRALELAGAVVINPARLPLRAQFKAYAGARHLVFAEGPQCMDGSFWAVWSRTF